MAGFLMMLIPFLFSITTVSMDSQRVCRDQSTNGLNCEVEEMKLKISRLESVLDETIESLNTKLYFHKEKEKLIEEMDYKIQFLQTSVINIKNSSIYAEERVKALEEEVRLLWAASRKNNFDLHILESKVRDTEIKLGAVTSKVETIASIVTEQWIQIRQLDQALQLTEVRILKAQRKAGITRCTFLKFIKKFYGSDHLAKVIEVLDQRFLGKDSSSYASKALYQVKRIMSAAQRYHHELQGYVKQEMEKYEFTAALANQEVVFFLASALITFPVLSAWCLDGSLITIQLTKEGDIQIRALRRTCYVPKSHTDLSLNFTVLLFLTFYCPQIQARESQLFSKFTLHHNNLSTNSNNNNNNNNNNNITTSSTITANTTTPTKYPNKETKEVLPKEEAPVPKLNEEQTSSFTPGNENGHGLYGDQGSTQFPPTTMTTTTTSLAEAPTDGDSYIDATYEDNNNPDTLIDGSSETPTNEYTGATYEENNNNNNNWSKMMKKKQGMSDTRFMENGRYFYHVNTNTNLYGNNEYRSPSLKGNNQEGFGFSSRGGGAAAAAGGRGEIDNYNAADNTLDDDEFNNYMEQDQFSDNINDQYVP